MSWLVQSVPLPVPQGRLGLPSLLPRAVLSLLPSKNCPESRFLKWRYVCLPRHILDERITDSVHLVLGFQRDFQYTLTEGP